MDVGIGLPNPFPGIPGRTLVEWARRAEDKGFSSLATIDRIAYPSYESLTVLAAAGAVTERIGLLTNILLAPTRDAVFLAKQAASVDQLAGGRLTLGIAVGGRKDDYDLLDRAFETRGRDFDAGLEIMHEVWAGKPLSEGQPAAPQPVDGSIPLLFGGTSDEAIQRTVKWGVGWTAGGSAPDQIGPFVDRLKAAWAEGGRTGNPRIVALTYFSLGDREEESKEYLKDYYAFLGPMADMIADNVPRGRDAVKQAVESFAGIGVDELIFDPTVADLNQVDLLADAVL